MGTSLHDTCQPHLFRIIRNDVAEMTVGTFDHLWSGHTVLERLENARETGVIHLADESLVHGRLAMFLVAERQSDLSCRSGQSLLLGMGRKASCVRCPRTLVMVGHWEPAPNISKHFPGARGFPVSQDRVQSRAWSPYVHEDEAPVGILAPR